MEGNCKSTSELNDTKLFVWMADTSVGILERGTTTKTILSSPNKAMVPAFVNGLIPSHLRKWMQGMDSGRRSAQALRQQRMSAEGRGAEPTDALHGAKLCAVVPSIDVVGVSEYVTAAESMAPSSSTEAAIACASDCEASSRGVSVRVEGLMKARSEYASAVEYEIEASRGHWSEVAGATSDEDDEKGELDQEVFARLQKTWGRFFIRWGDIIEVGEKIAEGGQAEIFKLGKYGVVKVMKEGFRLRDLEKQWPLGMLQNQTIGAYLNGNSCAIYGATLLKNGRFAFWMNKYWGDLRKLIDMRMQLNHNQCPPFTSKDVEYIVKSIASGMERLHADKIVHRDLKASNVLISFNGDKVDPEQLNFEYVHVADFECSVGVVGTGYWRAPEILQAVQQCDIKPKLFTEKSDVYAFGMTCYEVLTGCIPFEELGGRCYNIVFEGRRPLLLEFIDPLWKKLLNRCWHGNPLQRPSFKQIRRYLKEMY